MTLSFIQLFRLGTEPSLKKSTDKLEITLEIPKESTDKLFISLRKFGKYLDISKNARVKWITTGCNKIVGDYTFFLKCIYNYHKKNKAKRSKLTRNT